MKNENGKIKFKKLKMFFFSFFTKLTPSLFKI